MTTIGIVTVTYNSAAVLDAFLESIEALTYVNFLLYIVDNHSDDGTLACIEQHADPRIRVIANGSNLGFAAGTNQGIRAALASGCSAVLLMNNDTEFKPPLLEILVKTLDEYDVDIVAPKIHFHDRPDVIWSAGGGLNPLKGYTGFHFGFGERDRGQFDTPRFVDHAPACCLLIRSEVFERIGFFDEHFFVYLEDTDFCYRAKAASIRVLYLPRATLLHKASTLTGGVRSEFTVKSLASNQIYFLLKHRGSWSLFYYFPAFQLYQLSRLLSRKISLSGFWLRQRAFVDGVRLWRQARRA
jgi:GT2 family glycosyltransferase